MFRTIIAGVARFLRRQLFGAASASEIAAERNKAFDAYAEQTRRAGLRLAAVQSDVIAEVNRRIDSARNLAAYAAQQLEDLADNGVLDGSNLSPAKARGEANRLRG